MMKFRIFGIAGAAILALALNGCGSSSSDPMEEMPPAPDPTPQEMAQDDLAMAKTELADLSMDATREEKLTAEQEVLTAAQALLTMYQANPDSTFAMVTMAQSEVATAMMAVEATQEMIDNPPAAEQLAAARMALAGLAADASAEDRATDVAAVVAALALAGNADAVTTTMEDLYVAQADLAAVPEGTSDQDMLVKQQGVVTAANAVVLGLSEGDAAHSEVVAAKMVLTDAEAAVATTEMAIEDAATMAARSDPLILVGAGVQTAVKRVNGDLVGAVDNDRAAAWLAQDPREGTFVKYVDNNGTDQPGALFTVGVKDQTISVTAMGAAVATDDGVGDAAGGDVLDLPKFKPSTSKDAPSLGMGWMSGVHERVYKRAGGGTLTGADDVVVMDLVTTYTNQDPAGDEYYATYYGVNKPEILLVAATDGTVDLTPAAASLAKSSGFPSLESQTYTFDGGAGNKPELKGDNVLLGTFNGVQGKFSCTDDNCVAMTDAGGSLSLINEGGGNNWVFTPDGDPEKIVVMGVIADVDYLTFGYWVETTTDNVNGRISYRVGVGHTPTHTHPNSSTPAATNIAATVVGTASYKGPAAGIFARRAYDPESGGDVETAGRFTADASLTADFDAADFTSDGSVSGRITNFMHAGSLIDSEWSVTMSEGNITAAGGAFASDPDKQALGDSSVWTGTFNGHYATDNTGTPANELKLQPTGATGTFSDIFDNGAVLGAFGVEKE